MDGGEGKAVMTSLKKMKGSKSINYVWIDLQLTCFSYSGDRIIELLRYIVVWKEVLRQSTVR